MNEEKHSSEILEDILQFMYPLIILFGAYIILTGLSQPGGGFQGGAVLVAIFMCRYLVYPDEVRSMSLTKRLDKIILIFILALASAIMLMSFREVFPFMNKIYNMAIGILIGIKVSCGLTVIFFTFAEIKGGEED
ncbi:MAG: MnhB domain-containing protein [Clostridia bacterium]|nr:MnhB domain-containing protein [Clostridia bacterium]